ncbi:unnamed protein product [Orchesella dallaii]|uniref:Histone-lysine N-methyltransferase, H3 lysine-79 specific n=1 Tax=Orchesella dallaii TaxID=48710 RepID=A0ABP1RW25_9HEXA
MASSSMELKLHSPVGAEPLTYKWPLSGVKFRYNKGMEIAETIRHIGDDIPEVQVAMENILKDFDSKSFESMTILCHRYNRTINSLLQLVQGTSKWKQRLGQQPSRSLLKHIIQQVYNMAVIDPRKLNNYLPFSPEVYGEASYELVAQMIDQIEITEDDVFIDLGSGIGQVVLQMAASTRCHSCFGIEKAEVPSTYARNMDYHFKKLMKWYGKAHGEYSIAKGDFLSEELRERITSATIIFVNNFAFGPQVDHVLKERFSDLRDGTRIISSKSFGPRHFRITARNENDVGAIMHISELNLINGSVSWTNKAVSYYLHVVDRTKLEQYLKDMKSRGRFKEVNNTLETTRGRGRDLANGKANCVIKPADPSSNDATSNSNWKENEKNEADSEESDATTIVNECDSSCGGSSKENSEDDSTVRPGQKTPRSNSSGRGRRVKRKVLRKKLVRSNLPVRKRDERVMRRRSAM